MHGSPTSRLARVWAQARSRLYGLGEGFTSSAWSREPAVRVAVVKSSDGGSRGVRDSGHLTALDRRSR